MQGKGSSRGNSEPQMKKRKGKGKEAKEGSSEEVLELDVQNLIRNYERRKDENDTEQGVEKADIAPSVIHRGKGEPFPETEVTISDLSSTGEGLALSPAGDHVYSVPFTVPGDTARVRIYRTQKQQSYSLTDLIEVTSPSPQRDNSLINCKYFGTCSGCQYQMLPYEDQLRQKKRVIEKAYANFSGLTPEVIPTIGDTFRSPLQYGYRTKLTPHFSQSNRTRRKQGSREGSPEIPAIGFLRKGRRQVMDIEDCPLGTDIVRKGLKIERKHAAENIHKFKSGATILVRESTRRIPKDQPPQAENEETTIRIERPDYIEEKSYITDQKGISVEYVEDYQFRNIAGTFFQNNNSILPSFIDYVRSNAIPPKSTPENEQHDNSALCEPEPRLKYLLDAYCGSGLFTIALSKTFRSSLGIDVAAGSITCARENAALNKLPNTGFAAADAAALFKEVPYPPDQTLLVIDPPRKGCDTNFLNQLLACGPVRVLYVSCNVHTQARDVGYLVQGGQGIRYEIESIRGFDFFPQTSHVESVAVLNKVVDNPL
ncbi:tRNA(m5U54)methyltransferase [Myotisia sp. PD_48]|nr:tRNA(m5U54)methyltransferase [Myotisia sp. PD_48]